MKKKIIPILLIGVLVLSGIGAGAILNPKSSSQNTIDEWYYYPQLKNYAPQGMPDFDQKQNNWKDPVYDGWTFCGAVSVSNIFWYLDSYYSDSMGDPGDGYDIFPIVLDYHAQSDSNPGPYTDDHNVNNANDLISSWDQEESIFGNELIERVAWYADTNGCRTGRNILGTNLNSMYLGVQKWFECVGLSEYFQVEMTFPPRSYQNDIIMVDSNSHLTKELDNTQGKLFDQAVIDQIKKTSIVQEDLTFHNIASKVTNGSFVILGINGMDSDKNVHFSHWVTVAGVSISNDQIALSDPYFDLTNHTNNFTLHNNAAFVSHDIYSINNTSPFPEDANYWWLEGYLPNLYSVVPAALIITPLQENIPKVPPITFFIKPDEGYLYFNEKHLLTTLLGNTIIFGDITFEANAFSKEGVDSIEFYINDELQFVDEVFPYTWIWNNPSFGRFNIKIKAIDKAENIVEKTMKIWRFF